MRLALVAVVACIVGIATTRTASAITIGTSTGDLIVHYNPAGPEIPANISYISTGDNVFNFNPALVGGGPAGYGSTHFFQAVPDQFKIDLEYEVQANSAPGIVAVDFNTIGGTGTTAVDWAITANQFPVNSPFYGGNGNGSNISIQEQTVTPIAGGFSMYIAGSLTTDDLIHWAYAGGSNGDGTSSISTTAWKDLLPDSKLYFHGTLTYLLDSSTNGYDVYSGTITYESALPLPTAVPMGLALFGGLAVGIRRRDLGSVA